MIIPTLNFSAMHVARTHGIGNSKAHLCSGRARARAPSARGVRCYLQRQSG